MPKEGLDAERLLGENGLVAQSWAEFETRPQQLEMAIAVQQALRGGYHLAAEAGTGIGKSFAYLAGAFDQALKKNGPVLISTYTIQLQEQLVGKDMPFLLRVIGGGIDVQLAKGRNHYLCRRRLDYARARGQGLFDDSGAELAGIADWSARTQDGSLKDLSAMPSPGLWQAVRSEHGNCRGRDCGYFAKCFYQRARRRLDQADIVVANHALLFSDLVLKEQGVGLLPDYKYVIVDEAHNLEHTAEDHFGICISEGSLAFLLDGLYARRSGKGLLAYLKGVESAQQLAERCRGAGRDFFGQVRLWYENNAQEGDWRCKPGFVSDTLTGPLRELRLALCRLGRGIGDEDEKYELTRAGDRCGELEKNLTDFLTQSIPGCVYWAEAESQGRRAVTLRSAPIDVGPYIKKCLFEKFSSVIATSATLSCSCGDEKEGFDFFAGRIGLDKFKSVRLGSPFDYARQVRLYIQADMPDPNHQQFTALAAEAIKNYLLKSCARAFVLFTSYSMLRDIAERLSGWLAEQGMTSLVQGQGMDRTRMLELFKSGQKSVLFGTDSFWQGVDVPGEKLSNVILVRLPFAVPSHPLIQGRIEALRLAGENPFSVYQLPMAVLKFKQGFGRLIRTKNDSGIVAVLDSRILNKAYGRLFLQAIPSCDVEIVSGPPA